jgi:hypothetical protein
VSTLPTYRQFREFALKRGLTPQTLAPYVQSDHPEKAAERLLIHLASTRWDDAPLPYPKLCQLYREAEATAPAIPASKGHVELADALVSGRKDRLWLKPGQFTVTHRLTDPYLDVTLTPDAPRDGIKTLAHLAGALDLEADADCPRRMRFPDETLCRLAEEQWRGQGDQRVERIAPVAPNTEAPRRCACGAQLTGQASQRFCSPRCRKQASRANPQRIASNSRRATNPSNHRDIPVAFS